MEPHSTITSNSNESFSLKEDAGLEKMVCSSRKSSTQRILEKALKESSSSISTNNREFYEEKQRQFNANQSCLSKMTASNEPFKTRRHSSPKESISSQQLSSYVNNPLPESTNENEAITENITSPTPKRRTSLYELKQVAAPVLLKGRRISLRTQSLLEQYEKDMSSEKIDSAKLEINEELNQLKNGRRSLGDVRYY
ncbi:uncharacterized protein LOC124815413 isoform X2 [Hydra vulgaris]|uniref:Uncharacterized protein LOC124815413 isoform X2 n=1 Tax=Hydra vulgaris TaxID=6087 RepID=A0ABM4D9Z4_HYDVU